MSSALSVPQTNSWLTRNTCVSQRNPSIWKVIYYPLSITTSNFLFSYDALPLTQACTSKSHEQKKSPNPIAYIAREKKTLQARPMTYHLHPCNTFSEEIRLTSQQRADGKQWLKFPPCTEINLSRNSGAETGTSCAMSGTFHKSKDQKMKGRKNKKYKQTSKVHRAREPMHTRNWRRACGETHVCMMRLFIMGQLVPP